MGFLYINYFCNCKSEVISGKKNEKAGGGTVNLRHQREVELHLLPHLLSPVSPFSAALRPSSFWLSGLEVLGWVLTLTYLAI